MENADDIVLESSKDDSNKDMEIENGKLSDEQNNSIEITSAFLTASELQSLRCNISKNKSKDDDLELYKGPKIYHPNECEASEEIIEDILHNDKKSLMQQRIAKNRDCMKAKWNEELKVAIVPHLKGKTTQHMGVNMRGNISLSPEEALFLLEKGLIEIEHNKMPLSIEEAYSVMLKEKLSVEKYQVYSFLSQQGFIVVQHQSSLCSKIGKSTMLPRKKQKKRKAPTSVELPQPKRLTFSGAISSCHSGETVDSVDAEKSALPSSCLLNVDDTSDNTLSVSHETLSSDKNISDTQNRNELQTQDISKNDAASSNISNGIESNAQLERETGLSCFQDKNTEKNVVKINDEKSDGFFSSFAEKNNEEQNNKDTEKEIVKVNDEESDRFFSSFADKNNEEQNNKDTKKETVKVNDEESGGFFSSFGEKSNKKQNNKDTEPSTKSDDASRIDHNDEDDIDVETVIDESEVICVNNTKDVDMGEVIIDDEQGKDKSSDINVEDTNSGYSEDEEYESTDEDIPLLLEESNDEESLDVYSYSPAVDELNVNTDNLSSRPSKEDDEITLVKVTKKEKKPLAVIDLLSDEEDHDRTDHTGQILQETTNGQGMLDDSDDDIQVLEECNGATNASQVVNRNVNPVKLESGKMKEESANVKTQHQSVMKFPELYKKDLMCIPRPPSYLLPLRVKPLKEAYVLHLGKSSQPSQGRLWNSYKDLQDYQRERRFERRMNSFRGRSSGPFRNQNDSYSSYQTQPVPFNRNSHQQNNVGYPHVPTSNILNSVNNVPISMNICNLQNLSSNPVAFANELQKTVISVATNLVSNMFSQMSSMSPIPPPSPAFSDNNMMGFPPQPMNNNFSTPPGMPGPAGYNSFGRNDFNHMRFPPDPAYSGERYPFPQGRIPFMTENSWRPPNTFNQRNFPPRGPLFPCRFRSVHRKRNWNDIKAVVGESNHSDSGSDIEEVPINFNQFLFSKEIQPLVKPGSKLPIRDVLKVLRITQMANLCDTKQIVDRYLPSTPSVEISFDVYPPNSKYKKSDPAVPKYRIIVVKSSDPIVRYSELVFLQRKWNDKASLQVAVVDHSDISFYSFKSINVQEMVPFES